MYILFDIGGTKMRMAASDDGVNLGEPQIIPTPQDYKEALNVFKQLYTQMAAGRQIQAIAGGLAGAFDRNKEKLLRAPHLPTWANHEIKKDIIEITGIETYLENDTALVGLGEAVSGVAVDYRIVAYMTVSTGVGGARIVDKKIDANTFGFEPGHQIIDADGTICPECTAFEDDKSYGHLEAHISGSSIKYRYQKEPDEIDDPKFWDDTAKLLAYGLNNTIVHWSPEIVVLGGGMMKSPGISIEKVKYHLTQILKIFPEQPDIKKAELGELGGLYGGLAYIKQLKESN